VGREGRQSNIWDRETQGFGKRGQVAFRMGGAEQLRDSPRTCALGIRKLWYLELKNFTK
jgi:hypothetical protein